MEIRIWEHNDLVSVLEINAEVDYWNPDNFMSDCINDKSVIVATIKGEILGFLLYQKLWGNTPFLALVKVKEKHQRKWIWKRLVEFFEEELIKQEFESYISSTELKNIDSQKFHDKLWLSSIWKLDMTHWKELFYIKELNKK